MMDDASSYRSGSPTLSTATSTVTATGGDDTSSRPSLYQLLTSAELTAYYPALTSQLKVRTCAHLKFVKDTDLLDIGMSKPEIRRLWKYHNSQCGEGGFFDRLKTSLIGRRGSMSKKVGYN